MALEGEYAWKVLEMKNKLGTVQANLSPANPAARPMPGSGDPGVLLQGSVEDSCELLGVTGIAKRAAGMGVALNHSFGPLPQHSLTMLELVLKDPPLSEEWGKNGVGDLGAACDRGGNPCAFIAQEGHRFHGDTLLSIAAKRGLFSLAEKLAIMLEPAEVHCYTNAAGRTAQQEAEAAGNHRIATLLDEMKAADSSSISTEKGPFSVLPLRIQARVEGRDLEEGYDGKDTVAEMKARGNELWKAGDAKSALGEWQRASEAIASGLILSNTSANADCIALCNNRAAALLKLKRWEEAEKMARSCLVHDPCNAKALFRIGHAMEGQISGDKAHWFMAQAKNWYEVSVSAAKAAGAVAQERAAREALARLDRVYVGSVKAKISGRALARWTVDALRQQG